MRDRIIALISLFLLASVTWGQQPAGSSTPPSSQQSMPGMDMPGHDMSKMHTKDMPMATDKDKDKGGQRQRCQRSRHAFDGRPHGHGPAHEDDGPAPAEAR